MTSGCTNIRGWGYRLYLWLFPACHCHDGARGHYCFRFDTATTRAPINQLAVGTALANPTYHDVVLPSTTTLYASSFMDLTNGPLIMHLPHAAACSWHKSTEIFYRPASGTMDECPTGSRQVRVCRANPVITFWSAPAGPQHQLPDMQELSNLTVTLYGQ